MTKFIDNMENATNTKTFRAGLYDNTPEGEVFVGYVLATIDTRDVNPNAGSSRYFLRKMLEVDDLPTFNILDSPDEADQPHQTNTATVPVDAHEDFDENIDLPDFDNLEEKEIMPHFGFSVPCSHHKQETNQLFRWSFEAVHSDEGDED